MYYQKAFSDFVQTHKLPSNMTDESPPKCNCKTTESEEAGSDTPSHSCCVKQRWWWMLHTKCHSDICFIVGSEPETQKIYAHKSVLSSSGEVFNAMFGGNWSSESSEIKVPDIEPAVFFSLLRFIYTDDIQLTADSVMKILYAAKKYAILSLEDRCADFLKQQLSPEDAWSLLTHAELFDQQKLVESCLEVIDENPEVAFSSDSFANIDLALLRSVLKRDTLRMDEIDIFEAVLRWSVAECERRNLDVSAPANQKLVLEDAVSLIRFPLMSQKDFASKVLPCGLVPNEICLEMFQYFSGIPMTLSHFSKAPRSSKEMLTVNRFEPRQYSSWSYRGLRTDGIGFSFDHNVRLIGFGLYQIYDDDDISEDSSSSLDSDRDEVEYKVDITVKNQETGAILYQDFSTHKEVFYKNTYKVMLNKAIKLTANTHYAVITKISGPSSIYGNQGKSHVSTEDRWGRKVTVTFQSINYEGSEKRTSVDQGQIPEILFNY